LNISVPNGGSHWIAKVKQGWAPLVPGWVRLGAVGYIWPDNDPVSITTITLTRGNSHVGPILLDLIEWKY
jgi:hypothetical protein